MKRKAGKCFYLKTKSSWELVDILSEEGSWHESIRNKDSVQQVIKKSQNELTKIPPSAVSGTLGSCLKLLDVAEVGDNVVSCSTTLNGTTERDTKSSSGKSGVGMHCHASHGIGPFACVECAELFTLKSDLDAHLLAHINSAVKGANQAAVKGQIQQILSQQLRVQIPHIDSVVKGANQTHISSLVKGANQCQARSMRDYSGENVIVGDTPGGSGVSAGAEYNDTGLCSGLSTNVGPPVLADSPGVVGKGNGSMLITLVGEKQSLNCVKCKRHFSSKGFLHAHMRNAHSMKPYPCPNCPEVFAYRNELSKHLSENCHSRGPGGSYLCPHCEKCFTRAGRLQEHLDTHTRETSYFCGICGKSLASKQNLTQHMETHNDNKRFKCNECERSFASITNLRAHMSDHTGIRPYKCKECPESFKRAVDLKLHMQDHTGKLAFCCPHCPKSFKRSTSFKDHLAIHTGDKPYLCSLCDKSFRCNSNLKVHLRTHSGERRYTCDRCNRAFVQNSHLKRHMKSHCEYCDKMLYKTLSRKIHLREVHNICD